MTTYDVAVIGAGAFGSWTAWWLGRAGKSVLLLDAWGPGHARSSSGGESRVIRMGYGADEIYTRMAHRSLGVWKDLFQKTGQPLFHQTGVVWMTHGADPHGTATCETLRRAGIPFEILSGSELAKRYPQMQLAAPDMFAIFEPESGALMARRAVAAVVEDSARLGVKVETAAVQLKKADERPEVQTSSGETIRAKTFVFACGPWLPKLFPELLGNRIFPTRQEVFFFAPPTGDRRFAPPHLPVWIDFTDPRGPYGFPDLETRGVKLAFDRHGVEFDPDSEDRVVSALAIDEAREFIAERFPTLRNAPLTESRVCQYENTSNGDFLIDRHPDFENVWLVGGGSGHGFKHAPAVGEYLCSRVLGNPGDSIEPRFSIRSKKETQSRTVF